MHVISSSEMDSILNAFSSAGSFPDVLAALAKSQKMLERLRNAVKRRNLPDSIDSVSFFGEREWLLARRLGQV